MYKIIHIAHFDTEIKTGVAESVIGLKKNQELLGHEIYLFNLKKDKSKLNKNEFYISSFSQFKNLLHQINPTIIIFHSLYFVDYILFYKYIVKHKYFYLIQPHGGMSLLSSKKSKVKKNIFNFLFLHSFIKNAKGVIFLNKQEYIDSCFKRYFNRYVVIPNGIEKISITNKSKSSSIIIGFLSRLSLFTKGIDLLIDAMEIISKKNVVENIFKLKIWGIGSDSEVKYVVDRIRNENLENYIEFMGPATGVDKVNAFTQMNIFILTSRHEGMPVSILEALSYGCPAIITEETNMGSLIKMNNSGWVTNLEAEEIALTILEAVKDYKEHTEVLIENAYKTAEQFLWIKIAEQSINSYKKLID